MTAPARSQWRIARMLVMTACLAAAVVLVIVAIDDVQAPTIVLAAVAAFGGSALAMSIRADILGDKTREQPYGGLIIIIGGIGVTALMGVNSFFQVVLAAGAVGFLAIVVILMLVRLQGSTVHDLDGGP